MYFYAYDGDNIGRHFECLVLSNDVVAIREFSASVDASLSDLCNILTELDCEIVMRGGDSVLANSTHRIADKLLPTECRDLTFSVGVGTTPTRAMLALKLAKGRGKNQVVEFNGEVI